MSRPKNVSRRRARRRRPVLVELLEPRLCLAAGQVSLTQAAGLLEGVNISGITTILHGYANEANAGLRDPGGYMLDVADAIYNKYPSYLVDFNDAPVRGEGYVVKSPVAPASQYEVILVWDWHDQSNNASSGWAESAADALFASMTGLGLINPAAQAANPALHVVAHSFGTVVASELVERLARYDVPVDHLTYFDPHDFDQPSTPIVDDGQENWTTGLPGGPAASTEVGYGASVWNNVEYADNYYQTRGEYEIPNVPGGLWVAAPRIAALLELAGFAADEAIDAILPVGRPIPGAANFFYSDSDLIGSSNDHSYMWSEDYLNSISNPQDYPGGYRYSRLSGLSVGNRRTAEDLRANTSDVTFYPTTPTNQDHKWSSTDLVVGQYGQDNRSLPDASGLASQGFTVSSINGARWAPRWDPLDIFNGDFESGPLRLAGEAPGWSFYGGENSGVAVQQGTGGTNRIALLGSENGHYSDPLVHSIFYLPPRQAGQALTLNFEHQRVHGSIDFDLVVEATAQDGAGETVNLANIPQGTVDSQLVGYSARIPDSLQGRPVTLTFRFESYGSRARVPFGYLDNIGLSFDGSALPDLVPQPIGSIPATVATGQSITIPVEVRNTGGLFAAPYEVGFRLSRDLDFDNEWISPITVGRGALGNGSSDSWNQPLEIGPSIEPGSYYVGVLVDPDFQINEHSHSNNLVVSTNRVTITTLPNPRIETVATPAQGQLDKQFNVRVELANPSSIRSERFELEYRLTADATVGNSDDVVLDIATYDGLASAGFRETSNGLQLLASLGVAPGTYRLAVQLDPDAKIIDANRTDNLVLSSPFTIVTGPPLVDLEALAVDGAVEVARGQALPVSLLAGNQGTTSVSQFDYNVWLSPTRQPKFDGDAILLSRETGGNIAAFGQRREARSVLVNSNVPLGDYYVLVDVDPLFVTGDTNLRNNRVVSSNTVAVVSQATSAADLTVAGLRAATSAKAGGTLEATVDIKNLGNVSSDAYELEYFLSRDHLPGPDDTPLPPSPLAFNGMAAGDSLRRVDTLTIPGAVAAGDYRLIAVLFPSGVDRQRSNDFAVFSEPVRISADVPSNERGFQFPIGNRVSGATPTLLFDGDTVDSEGVLRTEHLGIDFAARKNELIYSIADGQVVSVDKSSAGWGQVIIIRHYTTAWGWDKDVYSMYAHVDSQVTVGEYVKRGSRIGRVGAAAAGNREPLLHFEIRSGSDAGFAIGPAFAMGRLRHQGGNSFTVAGSPDNVVWHDPWTVLTGTPYSAPAPNLQVDLVPLSLIAPREAVPGGSIEVSVTVANRGAGDLSSYSLQFYLSENSSIGAHDRKLGGIVTRGFLAAGATHTFTRTLTVPADVNIRHAYWIGYELDPLDAIDELDDAHNFGAANQATFIVSGAAAVKPDLAATQLAFNPALQNYPWGGRIGLSYSIANVGKADATQSSTVRFTLADHPTNPTIEVVLADRKLGALAKGRTAAQSAGFYLPNSAPAGLESRQLYVRMIVDALDAVSESEEGNNERRGRGVDWISLPLFDPNEPSDIHGESFRINPIRNAYQWGQQIDLIYRFVNDGPGTSLPFSYQFVLSDDPWFSSSDYVLSTRSSRRLDPGASYTETVPIWLPDEPPSGLANGPLYVGVVVDPDRSLREQSTQNNRHQGQGIDWLPLTIVPPTPLASGPNPEIGNFTATPTTVLRGRKIDLVATGVIDDKNAVNDVVFRMDTNGNGQFDSSDLYLAHGSKVGTTFDATVRTDGSWPAGPNTILARATDNHGLHSDVASVVVTVEGIDNGPFADDAFEENDTWQTSTFLGGGVQHTLNDLRITPGDHDYFMFEILGDAEQLEVRIDFFEDSLGDLDLFVYRVFGGQLKTVGQSLTSQPGTTFERVTSTATSNGRYVVRVIPAGSDQRQSDYDLRINLTPKAGAPVAGPLITSLASPVQGEMLTLSMDDDSIVGLSGTNDRVDFYVDLNHDGSLDVDTEHLGTDYGMGDGPAGEYTVTVSTATWPLGNNTIVARAKTDNSFVSLAEYAQVTVLENHAPTVTGLQAPSLMIQGGTYALTAENVVDPDARGAIAEVAFYIDSNSNQQLDAADVLIGRGVQIPSTNHWTAAINTTTWPVGDVDLFVATTDHLGAIGASAVATASIIASDNQQPTLGGLAGPSSVVKGAVLTLVASEVEDPNADAFVVRFLHDSNANGVADAGDQQVGTVTQQGSKYSAAIDTSDLLHGRHTFFVQIVDAGGPPLTTIQSLELAVIDNAGPRVIAQIPDTPIEGTISEITLTFDEPIDVATLTLDDVASLTGPNGAIAVQQIDVVNAADPRAFRFRFAAHTTPGAYALALNPGLVDLAGNVMDQDGDGTGGEAVDDVYRANVQLTAPAADFEWVHGVGGSLKNLAFAAGADPDGNLIVAGEFVGTMDYDTNPTQTANLVSQGGTDGFIVKYAPTGNYLWSVRLGAGSDETIVDLTVDAAGNTFVIGGFSNTTTLGAANYTANGSDGFLVKISPAGQILWSRQLTGTGVERALSVTADGAGNVYVAGWYTEGWSANGMSLGATSGFSDRDIFVASWSGSGGNRWAKRINSSGLEHSYDVAADSAGGLALVGYHDAALTFGSTTLAGAGGFVTRLSAATGSPLWALDPGPVPDQVAVNANNQIAISGTFQGTAAFPAGSGTTKTSAGGSDAFVSLLDTTGAYQNTFTFGGTSEERPYNLRFDPQGDILVAGHFQGTADFDPSTGVHEIAANGGSDAFAAKYRPDGTVVWARQIGSTGTDRAYGIVAPDAATVYVAGYFENTATTDSSGSFPVSITSQGQADFFIAKIVDNSPRTYVVSNTADSGAGSLRAAIEASNGNNSLDTIRFDLAGSGPFTIRPQSALPAIQDPMILDGTTQPGYIDRPLIQIDGSQAGNVDGFVVTAGNTLIRGLAINRFSRDGIVLDNGDGNRVQANFLGLDVDGVTAAANGFSGVVTRNASHGNVIGTDGDGIDDATEGNVITGNRLEGVAILGTHDNIIAGNRIGTSLTGNAASDGNRTGVWIKQGGKRNRVGSDANGASDALERNLLSGNRWDGVMISDAGSDENVVAGNWIGLAADGATALGNNYGVRIDGAAKQNRIGVLSSMAVPQAGRNVIAANRLSGVLLIAAGTEQNVVAGNFIGTDVSGTLDRGNLQFGILVEGASNNQIGGSQAADRNLISGNDLDGIAINKLSTDVAANTIVAGNWIGADVSGALDLGNTWRGVAVYAGTGTRIGLAEAGGGNLISGNNAEGIYIGSDQAIATRIEGNLVGLKQSGDAGLPNNFAGITLWESGGTTIGGLSPLQRNVISGHVDNTGIFLQASTGNTIQGNWIGLGADGARDLGNSIGISLAADSDNNQIGGAVPAARNVISGNGTAGIALSSSDQNRIQGNWVGTDASGELAVSNDIVGIWVGAASRDNLVGGTSPGERNIVSGNADVGIGLQAGDANQLYGNWVGLSASGQPLANRFGIFARDASDGNAIGGWDSGQGNWVAHNLSTAIGMVDGVGNTVIGNRITDNNGLAIDLGWNGVTVNDANDADDGANGLQNHPVLSTIAATKTRTTVYGDLDSLPSRTFRVDVYASATAPAQGISAHADIYLGAVEVTTDSGGSASFSVQFDASITAGTYVTATATEIATGNTSEFSSAITPTPQTFTVTTTSDLPDLNPGNGVIDTANGLVSLRAAIQESNALVTVDEILLGAAVYQLTSAAGDTDEAFGDLDISDSVRIAGVNAAQTQIVGTGLGRLFEISSGVSVQLESLFLRDGSDDIGGGILNYGELDLRKVRVFRNTATLDGGGIANFRTLRLDDVWVFTNTAGRLGGGVYHRDGLLRINSGSIGSNVVTGVGGGAGLAVAMSGSSSAEISIQNATFFNNRTTIEQTALQSGGGGILVAASGGTQIVDLNHVTFHRNRTSGGRGSAIRAVGSTASLVTVKNSIVTGSFDPDGNVEIVGAVVSGGHNAVGAHGSANGFPLHASDVVIPGGTDELFGTQGFFTYSTYAISLIQGSVAVDLVPASAGLAVDVRGVGRGIDGTRSGQGNSDAGAFEFRPPSMAPIANPAAILEDAETQTLTLTGLAPGVGQGNAFTVTATASSPSGLLQALTVDHDGLAGTASLSYKPAKDQHGATEVTVTVTSAGVDQLLSETFDNVVWMESFVVTVLPVNDPPVALDDNFGTPEDTDKSFVLQATDVDSSTLTYAIVSPPTHGILLGAAPNLTYRPADNYTGSDSFTFEVSDGSAISQRGTVDISVNPVNDKPTANPQDVATNEDVDKPITLSGADVEGATLTYSIVSSPQHGVLLGTAPNLTYDPADNFSGADSFTFKVSDNDLESDVVTVNITVNPVNDAPTAIPQTLTTDEDSDLAVTLAGTDIEGGLLTYLVVSTPSNGALVGEAPNLTYDPADNFAGQDSFTYKVNDGVLDSPIVTVTLIVTPVNDRPTMAPIVDPLSIQMNSGEHALILRGITAGAEEVQPLRVEASSDNESLIPAPTVEYVDGDSTATLRFSPAADAGGSANITVTITDGGLDGDLSTSADNGITTETFTILVLLPPAGVELIGNGGTINEGGGLATYSLSLERPPTGTVEITARADGQSEISLDGVQFAATQTFVRHDRSPQQVIVRAVDDASVEGSHFTQVTHHITGLVVDTNYPQTLPLPAFTGVVSDNDVAGIRVVEIGGSTIVSEDGAADQLHVVLIGAPLGSVVVTIVANDPSEAAVAPASLTFTPDTWDLPQTVVVSGADDSAVDGDQTTTLTVSVDTSQSDPAFWTIPPQAIAVVTLDDESAIVLPAQFDASQYVRRRLPGVSVLHHTGHVTATIATSHGSLLIDEAAAGVSPGEVQGNGTSRIIVSAAASRVQAALAALSFYDDQAGARTLEVDVSSAGIQHRATSTINVVENLFPWHNADEPADIDGDGLVLPEDILEVVTDLLLMGARLLTPPPFGGAPMFLDAIPDNLFEPNDLLEVLNVLILRTQGSAEAEGPPQLENHSPSGRSPVFENDEWAPADPAEELVAAVPGLERRGVVEPYRTVESYRAVESHQAARRKSLESAALLEEGEADWLDLLAHAIANR